MSVEAAERYVRAGAALLDEKGPEGWRETLYERREELDVSSMSRCPLGLLYGSFGQGVDALWPGVRDDVKIYTGQGFTDMLGRHGFEHSDLARNDPDDRANYTELTRVWLDEIEPLISGHIAQ